MQLDPRSAADFGEIVAIAGAMFFGMPLIMLPVQILWMNVVTDGVTALALGLEEAEPDIMRQPPRDAGERILSPKIIALLIAIGLYEGLAALAVFWWKLPAGLEAREFVPHAATVAFTGLIIFEKINVLNFRSFRFPLSRIGLFSNPHLVLAIAATLGIQAAAVYLPFMQKFLHTTPLSWQEWLVLLAIGSPLLIVGEIWKHIAGRGRTVESET